MVEIELKFQLPKSKKRAVLQRLKKEQAKQIHLQAKYFDTSDRILAQNNMAIRLRLEGETWVQTFKAATGSHLQRIEDEIDLGHAEPELDINLYEHKPHIKKLLQQVLSQTSEPLQLQFETNVQRYYQLFHVGDSAIEVCLDDGEVLSPNGKAPICEVEFELKQGDVSPLIELAKQWVNQYELWLDVRSKAERGNLLAMGKTVSPAVTAKPIKLSADWNATQALQHIVGNCLNQLLPNAAAIAGDVAEAEHIHQARVAIRRLRSALKHFDKWSSLINSKWQQQLGTLAKPLGTNRDFNVVETEVLPQLTKLLAPALTLAVPQDEEPLSKLFIQAETVNLLLDLLTFTHTGLPTGKIKPSLQEKAAKVLQGLHTQLIEDAKHFNKIDIEARHKVRKDVKQLRYCTEFMSSLFAPKEVKHYLKQLEQVQNHLGSYNDMVIAQHIFEQQIKHDEKFWFALGWNSAQQQQLLVAAEKSLKQFSKAKTFW
jgi:inorganic triphosphatase YgiF